MLPMPPDRSAHKRCAYSLPLFCLCLILAKTFFFVDNSVTVLDEMWLQIIIIMFILEAFLLFNFNCLS